MGLLGRLLLSGGIENSFLADLLPWMRGTPVTLYFGDGSGTYLVPVSRTLTGDNETPEGLVAALLRGPEAETALVNLVDQRLAPRSISVSGSVMHVDFPGDYLEGSDPLAAEAMLQTLASWPDTSEVIVTVDGAPVPPASRGGHLLYFYDRSRDMLVATPASERNPRDLLDAYLAGPDDIRLTGLPSDVELIEFTSAPGSQLLTVNMTYTPSVQKLATDDGDAMRRVLEGLIATLTTGFPDARYVYLDFEGHATLGLGQCANLLRRAQPPPEILNDERLLRAMGAN